MMDYVAEVGWAGSGIYDVWFSPITGDELNRCPWLRKLPRQEKYICRIYDARPSACRAYPVNLGQAIQDDCEMVEAAEVELAKGA